MWEQERLTKFKVFYFCLWLFVVSTVFVLFQIFSVKKDIPVDQVFTIEKNDTGTEILSGLEDKGFIRSAFWGKVTIKIFGKTKFYPGEYRFEKAVSTYQIIYEIFKKPISLAVLIPEGFTKKQIAERVAKYVKKFDKKVFLDKAEEGYLFPDTYYFYSFATTEEVLKEFNDKFNEKMFKVFGKMPTKEQVIIASMLEREARTLDEMQIISGIYQNRLQIDMPLQVDATVLYGNGLWKEKTLYSDLKKKSNYNTYLNTGLPIGPISNPGIEALTAAIKPKKNDFLFYLTGRDGKMYYSNTFEEHSKYKRKYLD